ncbi:PepSY-associated TM helix domain-containing protein [Pedobacter duraquae]|uniref:Putative iron-regulated membrane protein n=1 Tax=Pedobacter duraquae TaxID=425511 RepID=A0A4R6IQG2_9SPHI|nr:PepSY-associated TM helix domain-containing protein [Pedobacter duraquae]TDO24205.1 putative iron-regulated membrane protein [Pedobacter duraquae]
MVANNPQKRSKPKTLKSEFGKVISFLHLWLGLAAGTILLVVALTGCILTFEDELTPIIYAQEQKVTPAPARLSADSLVSLAKLTYPKKKIFRIYLPAEKDQSVKVTFGTKKKGYDYLYMNPYTGAILAKGKEAERFFPVVLNLHRYLLAGDTGKIITGISCAITFFMTLSGLYLWWPNNKKVLKQRLKVKMDASRKRLNWDLHGVGGFYAMIFLFFITLTGLIWSYDWVETMMFKMTDGKKEQVEVVKEPEGKIKKEKGIVELVVTATNTVYPTHGQIMITFPDKKGKPFTVSKENSAALVDTVSQLYLDSRTAKVLKVASFSSLSLGSQVRKLNKSIHTGSILGWPTKIIAFLTALITASLPITGLLIWLGRGKKKKSKPKVNPLLSKPEPAVL